MDIETISVQCHKCGKSMEYWTRRDFINCVECGARIEVEPCEDIAEELELEDGDVEHISVYS